MIPLVLSVAFERNAEEELVELVRVAKGTKSNVQLAAELGITEGMVRALLTGSSRFGADTLGALLVWDVSLEPAILAVLRERGEPDR